MSRSTTEDNGHTPRTPTVFDDLIPSASGGLQGRFVRNAGASLSALATAVVMASQGCTGPAEGTGFGVTHDTVAGVEHVITSGPGAWAGEAGAWGIDEAAGVVIGEVQGDDRYVFGRISGVTVDSEGRIYVADSHAKEIRVFSREGEFLRLIGRDGEGPGEFRHLGGLALAPDGVAALDGRLARVTVFGPTGGVVRSFRLQRPYMLLRPFAAMGFDPRGRFFDRAWLSSADAVDSIGVTTFGVDGTVSRTAFLAEVKEDFVVVERNGEPYLFFRRPLAPRPSFAFGLNGLAYLSRGDDYRIDVFSPEGDSLRSIRRPVDARPVTSAQRDSAFASAAEIFERAGGNTNREIELPDRNPVISGLVPDSEGNLWVLNQGSTEDGRAEWSVHDQDGRYLGAVVLPAMTVSQIGADFVAGTTTDELGVARAVVFPLLKGNG